MRKKGFIPTTTSVQRATGVRMGDAFSTNLCSIVRITERMGGITMVASSMQKQKNASIQRDSVNTDVMRKERHVKYPKM